MTVKTLTDRALENWPAKIMCITLSLLLFLFYRMSTLERRYFSVPLKVETNGDLVPAVNYPRSIKVNVRGEKDLIYPVQEDDIQVYVDLSHLTREGEYRVPVETRLKGSALDIESMEVSLEPSEILLRVEHRIVKKVSVTPSFKGYPEAGYEFSGYIVNPSIVEISGPRSSLGKITDIVTEQIDLSGRNAAFEGSVPLVNTNNLVSVSGSGKIEYRISVNQTTLIRTFEGVPFFFENLDPSFEVDIGDAAGTVQIKGSQTDLSGWALPANVLTVLCESIIEPGVYSLPVQVIVTAPFEVVSSSPPDIQLTVRRKQQ